MGFVFNTIRECPLRKILAILATFVWISVVITKLISNTDIPTNVYNLLWSMCGMIYGGYFGTSTIEAVKNYCPQQNPTWQKDWGHDCSTRMTPEIGQFHIQDPNGTPYHAKHQNEEEGEDVE